MLNDQDYYKGWVKMQLFNFSSEGKELSARELFSRLRVKEHNRYSGNETDETQLLVLFRRTLANIVEILIVEEDIKRADGQEFEIILSNDKGYYVSRSQEDAINGIDFLESRIKPIYNRKKRLMRMVSQKYGQQVSLGL